MKEEYSPYKVVHHLEKLNDMKRGFQVNPTQVQLVPINACPQKCSFCAYRMKESLSNEHFHNSDKLSLPKMIEVIDDMVSMGIYGLQLTGGGEPLFHPDIMEVLSYAISKSIHISLVTNGQLLTKELCKLLGKNADWVRISIDAGSASTYSSIRKVPENIFEKVLSNIDALLYYNKRCTVGIGFVVNKDNWQDITIAGELFKKIGVHNIRYSAAFTPFGIDYFKDFENQAKEMTSSVEGLLTDTNFTVFNLFNDRISDLFEGVQNYDFCPIKDLTTYIGADYNVYTCCTLAYNDKGFIGSIKDQRFLDLWNSNKKQSKFTTHNPKIHCQHPCIYKQKNEFINYCIKPDPKHIHFI